MKMSVFIIILFSFRALAAGPLLYVPVTGSCPKVMKKEKFVCDNADGVHKQDVELATFPAKASAEVKTRTQTCDKDQIQLLLDLLASILTMEPAGLGVLACTAFLEQEKSAKTFLFEAELIRKEYVSGPYVQDNRPLKVTLLAKKTGAKMEDLISYASNDLYMDRYYRVEAVCDTDNDKKADIIIHSSDYNGGEEILIFKNLGIKGFSNLPETLEGKPGCGC